MLITTIILNGCQKQRNNYIESEVGKTLQAEATFETMQYYAATEQDDNAPKVSTSQSDNTTESVQSELAKPQNQNILSSKAHTQTSNNIQKSKNNIQTTPSTVIDLWQPNEAQIARGQDLIDGLHEEIGHNPSFHEIERILQTHMGLSKTQAQKVIAALTLTLDQS